MIFKHANKCMLKIIVGKVNSNERNECLNEFIGEFIIIVENNYNW